MWCEHAGGTEESGLLGLQFNFHIATKRLYVTLNLIDSLKLQYFGSRSNNYTTEI